MRIEHQGYTLEQPAYQHVGYLSAALMNSVAHAMPLSVACLAIGLAFALVVGRKTRALWGGLVFLLVVLPCGAWALSIVARGEQAQKAIDITETLQALERVCEATEEWSTECGRLPTEAEWQAKMASWGSESRDYRYTALDRPGRDGQPYEVVSTPKAGLEPRWDRRWPDATIRSSWLGADGLYGTDDDDAALETLIADVRYVHHHRQPRVTPVQPPTPPDTSPPPGTPAS